ncbi:MAG: hypothetical protein ACRDG5_01230, partial [Anaerolineales bacterium]
VDAARLARPVAPPELPRRVLLVGYLRWWLEFACALGLILSALGHEVDLGFLPFRTWTDELPAFDVRRQRIYLRNAIRLARGLLRPVDLLAGARRGLPSELEAAVSAQSVTDVQYTLQREDLDLAGEASQAALYRLRYQRNRAAASGVWGLLARRRYDAVVVPNGSILELGAVYRAARLRRIPVVTYEFGEQRERIWLARDAEVMRHDTTDLWQARRHLPLAEVERQRLERLMDARRGGRRWSNFGRQWQAGAGEGAAAAAQALGMDRSRRVVLVCTNVVGDSLALGRQVFTQGMADWLAQTVRHFASRRDVQVVVRVHPGELLGAGHTSEDIVHGALPSVPPHVLLVPPDSKINTYDLVELADLGLVYTTTVGLEMAMAGVPVVVAGQTHYRGKGFTYDPASLPDYFGTLDRLLARPDARRLSPEQVETAWHYAYRFFFDFPLPFPWHLLHFWKDMRDRPFEAVVALALEGPYRAAFEGLMGGPAPWETEPEPPETGFLPVGGSPREGAAR